MALPNVFSVRNFRLLITSDDELTLTAKMPATEKKREIILAEWHIFTFLIFGIYYRNNYTPHTGSHYSLCDYRPFKG